MDGDNSSDGSTEHSIDARDYTIQELHALFSYSPPSLTRDPEWHSQTPLSPFWFYDKHLDENLQMLHVKPMPTLLHAIAGTVDSAMEEHGIVLPPLGDKCIFTPADERIYQDDHRVTTITDDRSVARFYNDTTAIYCETVASMLGIHPHAADWMPALMWTQVDTSLSQPPGSSAEGYSIRVRYNWVHNKLLVTPELMECLNNKIVEELEDIARRFRDLATWQICVVSDQTEAVFRDMDKIISSNAFQPKICGTRGYMQSIAPPCTQTPDARFSPWKIGPSSKTDEPSRVKNSPTKLPGHHLRRSTRLSKTSSSSTVPGGVSIRGKSAKARQFSRERSSPKHLNNNIKESLVCPGVEPDYCSYTAEDLMQHAWTRSVREDTTIIVFYCGNFERIGIRHRQTQTLYLSKLIDIAHDKEPAHGKLHIGLYLSAFRDAIDRAAQIREVQPETAPPNPVKRRAERERGAAPMKKARQKVDFSEPLIRTNDVNMAQNQILYHEAGLRNLALTRLQYGPFNSVSPASFIRIGRSLPSTTRGMYSPRARRQYSPHEYLTLVLHSVIAHGATGILHKAELVLEMAEGTMLHGEVIVKLAFSDEQQERMQHEYSIYDHMTSAGIKGIIVDVLGLFRDLEGGPMALIMSNAGTSLWDRRPSTTDLDAKASSTERAAFLQAMQTIHDAGVRHNDLSYGNLLVNDAAEVAIVDFDRADLISSKGARKRELARLARTLDGDYLPPDGFSSDPTTPTSGYRSTSTESTATP